MLVIRMQRTGRKGHAMFRVVVQDSRRTPTSGKIVAQLGSYDPHTKAITLKKDRAEFYLEHGAQPSERVARLLKAEGIKLPDWVSLPANKERTVRHADKRRSTMPPAPADETPVAEPAVETPTEAPAEEASAVDKPEAEPEIPTTEPETADVPADEPEAVPATDETAAA